MKKTKLFAFTTKILTVIQYILTVCVVVGGFLYKIDFFKKFINAYFFEPKAPDSEKIIFYFSLVLSLLLIILARNGTKSDALLEAITNSKINVDQKFIRGETIGLFDDIELELIQDSDKGTSENTINILAVTMSTVWTKLESWQEINKLHRLTINIYYPDPKYISSKSYYNALWASTISNNIINISKFKSLHKADLLYNKVSINLKPYYHLPAIHGVEIARKVIYMSFSPWNKAGELADPSVSCTYIKLIKTDKEKYSIELRKLFHSWLWKASGQLPVKQSLGQKFYMKLKSIFRFKQ